MNMPKPFVKKGNRPSMKKSGSSDILHNGKKGCFNIDELLQFEAARQRALAQMAPDDHEKPFNEYVPYRIFINNIDTFNGMRLVKSLSQKTRVFEKMGVDEEEGEEEEEVEEEEEKFYPQEAQNSVEEIENLDDVLESVEEEETKPWTFSHIYEILGTLDFVNNPKYSRPEGILELLDQEKKSSFLEKLLTCSYIIYDITLDLYCHPKQIEEAKWVAESIVKRLEEMEKSRPKAFYNYTDCRTMILISTLLTWAKTKPIDPNDPSLPFTERDFRKRRPHPNYKIHCDLEKRIIELGKKYPEHFRTIVVGSGIPYGHEEDILHFYFKMAWQDASHLPIFGSGTNILPVIHIDSLSEVIASLVESFPPKYKYIIATDPNSVTLKEIVKLLAKNLGNGKTLKVSKEEAFLYPQVKQINYDMLTCNVNIVPGYIMDNMSLKWGTDRPFNENIPQLILEFKKARGLLPVKIFIHGPPASGKTFLAERLANYYDIPHLHVKGVIDETIQKLKDKIEAHKEKSAKAEEKGKEGKDKVEIEGDEAAEEDEEGEEDDEEGESLQATQQYLREIEDNMDNEKQRLDEEFVIRIFKEKMLSNSCMNKGFIIDGYPKTMEHTKALYEPEGGVEMADAEDSKNPVEDVSQLCNMNIMPEYVESLDASDEFLINRVIKLPSNIKNHFEEKEMCRRLTQFRAFNTEDNTPLIFYDELEVHPMIYNVENDKDPQMEPTFQAIIHHVGSPRNYGKESTDIEDILRAHSEPSGLKQNEELRAQREEIKKASQERRDKLENWMFLKNQELEMEEKALMVMGMPLRHYLMKYIFPTLTRGLVEVARLRPDDPVDFLSEFLFRENPEGKMFQPNYEEREEKLLQAIQEYDRSARGSLSEEKSSGQKSVRSGIVSKTSQYKCSLASTVSSKVTSTSLGTKHSTKSSEKSSSSAGVCTCQKSPSVSTCSSDQTPSTAASCTCTIPEPCEPCTPCSSSSPSSSEKEDPRICPCEVTKSKKGAK